MKKEAKRKKENGWMIKIRKKKKQRSENFAQTLRW